MPDFDLAMSVVDRLRELRKQIENLQDVAEQYAVLLAFVLVLRKFRHFTPSMMTAKEWAAVYLALSNEVEAIRRIFPGLDLHTANNND